MADANGMRLVTGSATEDGPMGFFEPANTGIREGDATQAPIDYAAEGASTPIPKTWLNARLAGAMAAYEQGKAHVEELDREQATINRQMNDARGVALRGLARLEGAIEILREQGATVPVEATP